MSWTNYAQGVLKAAVTPPLAGSDGNMWLGSGVSTGAPDNVLFVIQTPGGGSPTVVSGQSQGSSLDTITNLATDGSYMMMGGKSGQPDGLFQNVAITGHATTAGVQSGNFSFTGLVRIGTHSYATGYESGAVTTEIYEWLTSAATAVNDNQFASGILGCPIYDGSSIWAAIGGGATIYEINPSTLSSSSFTLTTSTLSIISTTEIAPQCGFDGSLMYLAANSGGIIVFDTSAHTSSLVHSGVNFVNCYYSSNLSAVVCDDTSGNIYTMPAGGGTLTTIGVKNTITGDTIGLTGGFGDGPSMTMWGSGNNTSTNHAYLFSFLAVTMKIVGII